MRRLLLRVVIGILATLGVAGSATVTFSPDVRHVASGLWNLPDRLPALATNANVHYEPGAEDYAREVLALLPDATARVEAVHRRPLAHPVTVAAYASMETYTVANGLGSTAAMGVTFLGRVNLSPKLYRPQHQRLRAILTHEHSHAHLYGWIGARRFFALPNWFKEGLAVMLSGGGGAELVGGSARRHPARRANYHR